MKVVFLFPLVLKSVNLKMSEDETKDYLMVRCRLVSWFSVDHNQRLSRKNLHLRSMCIYCFILISMTRKRRSGPWQKLEVNVLTGRKPYVHTNTTHITNIHYHPFKSLNATTEFKVKFQIWSKKDLCKMLAKAFLFIMSSVSLQFSCNALPFHTRWKYVAIIHKYKITDAGF
jgi:hypothetical protein